MFASIPKFYGMLASTFSDRPHFTNFLRMVNVGYAMWLPDKIVEPATVDPRRYLMRLLSSFA
jgi:hypothetical protein